MVNGRDEFVILVSFGLQRTGRYMGLRTHHSFVIWAQEPMTFLGDSINIRKRSLDTQLYVATRLYFYFLFFYKRRHKFYSKNQEFMATFKETNFHDTECYNDGVLMP